MILLLVGRMEWSMVEWPEKIQNQTQKIRAKNLKTRVVDEPIFNPKGLHK